MKNKIILYHGSDHIIQKPIFGYGRINNDYGPGFYCTKDIELAKEWACQKGLDGFANKYELDLTDLNYKELDDSNVLEWIALLMNNRKVKEDKDDAIFAMETIIKNFLPDISPFDVIEGYRADDSYFDFARDFIENGTDLEDLKLFLHLADLGKQIVLISPKSFERIKFLGFEHASHEIYFPKSMERDRKARMIFKQKKKENRARKRKKGTYVQDIVYEIINGGNENEPSL